MIDKESKWKVECEVVGFTWLGKVDANRSRCSCNVCGGVGEYDQSAMRRGDVRCSNCQLIKYKQAAKDGWVFVNNYYDGHRSYVNIKHYCCDDSVKVHAGHYLKGVYDCPHCQITKYQQAVKDGWEFINHFSDGRNTFVNIKHSCCDDLVKVYVSSYLKGEYDCPHCRITKYKSAAKQGWEFINHFRKNGQTYVNLKHDCCDDLVEVQTGHYLNGAYDCPHCMHTHFSDPSYFYVIQVGDIIKLGISNRPDHRYKEYGLQDDSTIIEHIRIPLETKRDALVVESHAKQLVKDYKLPTDIAKQVFTKSGYNECYSLESLEYLLTI